MQKQIFDKFLAKLDQHCEKILIGSDIDYRRLIAQISIEKVVIKHLSILLHGLKINGAFSPVKV